MTITNGPSASTVSLKMSGSANKTYTYTAGTLYGGSVFVSKTGGAKVTLNNNLSANTAGQDLTIQSGILDLNGKTLTVNDVLTIDAGATLKTSGGTYTPNSGVKFVNNGSVVP